MKIELATPEKCTGCAACYNVCPYDSIVMIEDENGFICPQIIQERCTKCGLCITTCPVLNPIILSTQEQIVYAAVGEDLVSVKKSSSGGIFPLLAEKVLSQGGVIYGCSLNEDMRAIHVAISTKESLDFIRGSKYIQSDIGNTYRQAKEDLDVGKEVLFSGTPCQVAGLKAFLKKDYMNLLTIDLVCHGVPSYAFFKQYIKWYETKYNVKILEYIFRDKTKTDIGCVARIRYLKKGKEETVFSRYNADYYYYYYYMFGKIYRNSCYSCSFANLNRLSDITLGDFWGIDKFHPEINIQNGMSVVIINTKKGKTCFDGIEAKKYSSNLEDAIKYNKSIISSVSMPQDREEILRLSREKDGNAIEKFFKKDVGIIQLVYSVKWIFPVSWKRKIKAFFIKK